MNPDVNIAIAAGLGAMLAWGTADFLAKFGIDRLGDQATLFWSQLAGVIPLIALVTLSPTFPDANQNDVLILAPLGIVSATGYLFLYSAFGKGQVSLLGPVSSSFGVGSVVLAVIFFGEHLTAGRALAVVGTLFGVVLIGTNSADLRSLFSRRDAQAVAGLREALFSMVCCSTFFVFFEYVIGQRDWVFFLLFVRAVATITVSAFAGFRGQSLAVPREHRDLWPLLILIVLCDVGAFASISYGFSHSDQFSIITVLSSTFSLVTIVLAWIFLKERMSALQFVGAATILACIALVAAL